MSKAILKPISNILRVFSFSTYSNKKIDPISSSPNSSELPNKAEAAQRIFYQFFKVNTPKQSEKSFLDLKLLQQEEAMNVNPYETLGIQTNSSMEKINHAFRQLAMKYHPKNDPSKEAGQKFVKIAWAYETLSKRASKKTDHELSLMNNFNYQIKQFLNNQAGVMETPKNNEQRKNKIKMAELYSETKKIKKFGGQKQVSLEKEYNRDGKLLKITRNQVYNEDGSVQISEILDNGHDIKTVRLYKQSGSSQMRQVRHSQD